MYWMVTASTLKKEYIGERHPFFEAADKTNEKNAARHSRTY